MADEKKDNKKKGPNPTQYTAAPVLVKYFKDTAEIRKAIREPFAETKEDNGMTTEEAKPHLDKLDDFVNLEGEGENGFKGNVPWKTEESKERLFALKNAEFKSGRLPVIEPTDKSYRGATLLQTRPDHLIWERGLSLRALIAIREEVKAKTDECIPYREKLCVQGKWKEGFFDKKTNPEGFQPGKDDKWKNLIYIEGEHLKHLMVKPETRRSEQTYFEHINRVYQKAVMDAKDEKTATAVQNEYERNVGPVNIFVSHAWKFGFIDVVNACEMWQKDWEARERKYDHQPFYYFFDYFAVNQHNPAADLPGLEEVIKESKLMLCMMNPYDDPITLGRSWCTLEMAVCEFTRTQLAIAFTGSEGEKFRRQFSSDAWRDIRKKFAEMDTEKATAWSKKDMLAIQARINSELGGYPGINAMCKDAISRWYTQQAKDIGDTAVKDLKKIKGRYKAAKELKGDEQTEEFKNLKKAMDECYNFLKNTATYLRQEAGEFSKSAALLLKATDVVKMLQEMFPDDKKIEGKLYKTQNSQANVYFENGQFEEALSLYRKAYVGRIKVLPANDIELLQSELNVARCINDLPLTPETIKESKALLNKNYASRQEWQKAAPARLAKEATKVDEEKDPEVKKKMDKKAKKSKSNSGKMEYKLVWPYGDLANLMSKSDHTQKGIDEMFKKVISVQVKKKNKRFTSYYKVLYAQHLFRVAQACRKSDGCLPSKEMPQKCTKYLTLALQFAREAVQGFRVEDGVNHPDTLRAMKVKIQVEYALNSELEVLHKQRYATIQKGLFKRVWEGERKEAEPLKKNQIQVMSWNVLADKLAYGDLNKDAFGSSARHVHWELKPHERQKLARNGSLKTTMSPPQTPRQSNEPGAADLSSDEETAKAPGLDKRSSVLNYEMKIVKSPQSSDGRASPSVVDVDVEMKENEKMEVEYPGRKLRVLAEILRYLPDVMVVNELDRRADLDLELERYGYKSVWKKKKKDFYEDGTGVYYQSRRFKLNSKPLMEFMVEKKGDEIKIQDQVIVAVELAKADDNTRDDFAPFVVAGIHLKSTKAQRGEKVRLQQAKFVQAELKKKWPTHEIILCSDLNAEAKGYTAMDPLNPKKKLLDYEPECHPWLITEAGYTSAYVDVTGKEPYVTSWKMRKGAKGSKIFKYTIDFIMKTKGIKTLSVLMPPDEAQFEPILTTLLPDSRCGSDHLPLVADVELPAYAKDDSMAGGCNPCLPASG